MPKGLEYFKSFFKEFTDKYIVIGGTACEEHFNEAETQFRTTATKDIDMVLIVEACNSEFVTRFWEYIKEGKYNQKQIEEKERKYYRFGDPQVENFPKLIELFSRKPDVITLKEGMHITPIPAGEDVSSLSAILLDDDYYNYLIKNSRKDENFHFASVDTLICLKAKAYLDMKSRSDKGEKVDSDDMKKHKKDVFRLATLLTQERTFDLPAKLKQDFRSFMDTMEKEPVDFKGLSKSMNQKLDGNKLTGLLLNNFRMNV